MNNIYRDIFKNHIICCENLLKEKIINQDEFLKIEQKIKEREIDLNHTNVVKEKEENSTQDSNYIEENKPKNLDYLKKEKNKFSFKNLLKMFIKTVYSIVCLFSMCISFLLEDYFSMICFGLSCFITLAIIRKKFNIKISNKKIFLISIILYCIGIIELFYNI